MSFISVSIQKSYARHIKNDKSSNGIIVTNSKDIDIYQCINEEHNNACKILLLSMYYFLLHRLSQLATHTFQAFPGFGFWIHGWMLVYLTEKYVFFWIYVHPPGRGTGQCSYPASQGMTQILQTLPVHMTWWLFFWLFFWLVSHHSD